MIKLFRILIIVVTLAVVIFFVMADTFVRLKGPEVIVKSLQKIFDREIRIGEVNFHFPTKIVIKDLNVNAAFSFKRGTFIFDFASLGQRQIVLSEVVLQEPHFWVERVEDGRLTWAWIAKSKYQGGASGGAAFQTSRKAQDAEEPGEREQKVTRPEPQDNGVNRLAVFQPFEGFSKLGLFVKQFKMLDASLRYSDFSVAPSIEIHLTDVFVRFDPLVIPLSNVVSKFECAGSVDKSNTFLNQNWFEIQGWMNLAKKDMELKLKTIKPNGKENLNAELNSRDNNMAVSGTIKLTSLDAGLRGRGKESVASENFWQTLKLSDVDADIHFSFKTRMDDFKVERVSIQGDLDLEGLRLPSLAK